MLYCYIVILLLLICIFNINQKYEGDINVNKCKKYLIENNNGWVDIDFDNMLLKTSTVIEKI